MKAKLSDAYLRRPPVAVLAAVEKTGRVEVLDNGGRGFGVRIGRTEKSFFLKRRGVDGKHARMSLGTYPAVSLQEARLKAAQLAVDIKTGDDPKQNLRKRKAKTKAEAALLFSELATRFISDYCKGKNVPLRPKTIEGYMWALQGEPAKAWADRPVGKITDSDIIMVVDQLEKGKKFASARLFVAYTRKFFAWCKSKRLISVNPAEDIPLGSEPKDFVRDRELSLNELAIVMEAAGRMGHPVGPFIKTLALLGQRRGETAMMRWAELDLTGTHPTWTIPEANTKTHREHDVALAEEVVAMLKSLPRIGEFVFTSDGKTSMSGFSKAKQALDDLVAKIAAERGINTPLPAFRLHDLRRSVATQLADLGVAPHVIEMILNHQSGFKAGVGGTYNKGRYDTERRVALHKWATKLSGLARLEK